MATQRKCIVCGKNYDYCPHCNKGSKNNMWKSSYCSENCRDIFHTCSNFEGKLISQEDAFNKLNSLNIKSIDVKKSVKGSVDRIMTFKKAESVVIPEVAPVTEHEVDVVAEAVTPNYESDEQSIPKRIRRNRSYKKYDEE